MTLQMVLDRLHEAGVRLRSDEGKLVVSGQRDRVDGALLEALRGHKAALLELLAREGGEWGGAPPAITPGMLPLVELTQAEIDRIVAGVPGGARNVQDIYPLAPLQEGILFHHLLAREGDPYLLASIMAFDGRARLQAYLDALQAVADRHDILRTAVVWEGLGEPVQVVWRSAPLPVQEHALDPAEGDVAAQLHERFHPRRHRIDLTRAPLLRLHFAHDAANDRWVLLQLMHHLVDDNTSLRFLRAEIRAHLEGRAHELPAPLPFRNFVAQARLGVSREAHEAYFRALLGDVDEPTAPFGLLDVWGDGSGLEEAGLAVDGALARRLRERAQALGVSAASVFHVAWAQVLARASGRDDVVFGTVLFGRMQGGGGAERVMGPFINTLPVRVRLDAAGAEASVRAMHAQLAELLVHEHASLVLAQRCCGVRAPAPLFTSLLNYRHGGGRKGGAAPGDAPRAVRQLFSEERTNYPVALAVNDSGGELGLRAQTPASVGAARVCAMVHRALEGLVDALEAAPDRAVATIDVLPGAERRLLLEEWSRTGAPDTGGLCIHERFRAQAGRTPDAVAVVFGGEALSYAGLERRAGRLARRLRGLGVGPDVRVAVCLERSLEMVVGMLAILEAGGAYVPLDPAQPPERLGGMLDDAGARLVLTTSALAGRLPAGAAETLRLDGDRERIAAESGAPLERTTLPDALAYVVFTSGSTGRPKGVAVPHAALASHMAWMQGAFPLGPDDRVLQKTPVGFDAAVWEFWAPLLAGATLVVAAPGAHRDPAALLAAVQDERITVLQLVPSMLGALLEHGGLERCATLRRLFCGGEALPAEAAAGARAALRGAEVVNLYGPAESTIDATSHAVASGEPGGTVPIGRAVDGVRAYVLGTQAEPVPLGVAGELCLGGAQLARGYLGRPEWTAETFVPDGLSGEAGARLYRTGDRVRWLPDGTLEFIGRVDHQVKVRGFRVEPGEVEARLREHPAVREVAVVAREDAPGDRRLVAYCVADEPLEVEALRRHVAERLPEYMVPATCVRLERLPLSPNGKTDRRALPAPAADAYARRGYEAPEGETEQALAEIWSEVLGAEKVGRRDDFFELGGHSLLVVRVISRVRQVLGAEVGIADLFEHPRLADFARALGEAARAELPPIERVDRGGRLPLSFAQQRLWFLEQMGGLGSTYHISKRLRLRGTLDRAAMVRALDRLVARHEALRTTFTVQGGEPEQRIAPVEESAFALVEHDLAADPEAESELRRLVREEASAPFDLETGPLIRGRLLRLAGDDHVLLLTMHHIVADGWSMGVLVGELSRLYGAFREGRDDPLPPLPIQYADYAAWQRRWVEDEVLEAQAGYWTRTLAGAPALLELPADHPRPQRQDHAGASLRVELDAELTAGLKALGRRHGTTLFMTLLAGWAAVLSRLSGQDDVVIGTPTANRGRREIEGLIGFFVNTLALRVDLSERPTVAQVLEQVKRRSLEAQQNQDIPFEQVVELVQPARSRSHTPLFQVLFAWQSDSRSDLELPGLEPGRVPGAERTAAKFDLTLTLAEADGRIVGGLAYATSLFERPTVERYAGYLRRVLEQMAADDARAVDRLELLSEAERRRVLEEWNRTGAPYPRDACVHELFEAQVERTPGAAAVVFGEDSLSYAELNARANRLAHRLRESGVGPDARVAICVERSPEMVVGVLATLKAGGAYVPLDPGYPPERLRYMLADSAPAVVLTQTSIAAAEDGPFAGLGAEVLALDAPGWQERPATNPERGELGPEHLANVIYTSGSTGAPKGVLVAHRGVCNLVAAAFPGFEPEPGSRVLQFASFSFDACTLELFRTLCRGAALCLAAPGQVLTGETLGRTAARYGITHALLPPAVLEAMPEGEALPSLRSLVVGGDVARESLVRRWAPGRRLVNAYGPSEITVCASVHVCRGDGAGDPPIGHPVANTRVYLLDRGGEPVPTGVVGELYIGGAGLARGYHGRPELTAGRFVPDPFGGEPGARLYRTGDLGRRRADGAIEFLGRNDFQVKVRGFRIEPGEIEARLREMDAVREALVLAREDAPGDRRLVAYYVGDAVEAEAMRAHLLERLPEHMVPAAYVRLEALPLTPNGKLDHGALPAPGGDAYARRGYEAPLGETEQALAEVWSELLGVERVGRRDDFFELGGHSLLAVQVVSRARQLLGAQVQIGDLFERPVLADFARALEEAGRAELPPIERVDRSGRLPLSFAQQRLWFLEQMGGLGSAYHVSQRLRLRGELDRDALVRALDRLVARHEALRTTFAAQGGEPEQRIAPATSRFHLVEHDLVAHPEAESELRRLVREEAGAPFDLETGPLVRGRLARLAGDDHVLLLTMHHIVADGWSMGVLVGEVSRLYAAFQAGGADPLPALPVQYADYAAWQRRWVEDRVLEAQAAYWTETLAGAPALLELPTDRPRPQRQDFAGASLRVELDAELTAGLKALSRRHGTTLFMTLLAGWAAVLSRLSGQDEVVIGTPTANRGRREIEGLIGFFVNTLALRVDLGERPAVGEVLGRVKARALEAQQNQDIPFEQVVERVRPDRSLSHSPLFQVLFTWQNTRQERLELPGLEPVRMPGAGQATAKLDLSLTLAEADGRIVGGLTYAPSLFERATVERHVVYLLRVLEQMAADDTRSVDRLELLPDTERRLVVEEWNRTGAPYAGGLCIHELFQAQAERTPDAVAVVFGDEALSYAGLDRRANRLAHHLRGLGVGPEARVGIHLERSLEMVVGLLAILKAGGAYVPLDPGQPAERLAGMLDDSGAWLVISSSALAGGLPRGAAETLRLDGARARIAAESGAPLERTTLPSALAYVVFTSGSMGRPKGVAVPHAALASHMAWMQRAFPLAPDDRVLQKTPVGFDAAVWEIWAPLLTGGTLVVAAPGAHRDPAALLAAVEDERVTVLQLVPSVLGALLEHGGLERCATLRRLFCGGEALPAEAAARARAALRGAEVVNLYGPTESTIDATSHSVAGGEPVGTVPIGRPVDGVRTYVLDPGAEPVPPGVAGELYLGGAQLARGYLRRPEWTAERFVPDGLSREPGARLYRTGDRVRWLATGELEFLGRVDAQVKVRGFRIEPGEIEARLLEHPAVSQAAVVAREDAPGDRRLVAYWVGEPVQAEALRAHLGAKLPEYMAPAVYVRLERLPLTPNGKLDRRALPAPEGDAYARRGYEAPVGAAEQALAQLWAELLGVERVGRRDHFFELGGHSLLAVQVVSRVRRVLGAEVAVGDLFERPVLADFARGLREDLPGGEGAADTPVPVRATGSETPLFLVHDGYGSVEYAQLLAWQIGTEIPVYALPPHPDAGAPLLTVRDMAARLVRMIRSVRPTGPYRIAGYSFGGLLAYEAAAQLVGVNQAVEFLGLIDAPPPGAGRPGAEVGPPSLARVIHVLSAREGREAWPESAIRQLASAADPSDPDALLRAAREAGLLTGHVSAERVRRLQQEMWVYRRARRDYAPPAPPVPVCYFGATQGSGTDPSRGWRALLPEASLRVTPVPGTHESMIGPDHAPVLGRALSREIARAAEGAGAGPPGSPGPVRPGTP